MAYFKDLENKVYWLDEKDIMQWKKPEWIAIDDAEAQVLIDEINAVANQPVALN